MAKDANEYDKAWNDMKSTMEKAGLADVNASYTKLWADFNRKYQETIGQ